MLHILAIFSIDLINLLFIYLGQSCNFNSSNIRNEGSVHLAACGAVAYRKFMHAWN